MAAKRKRTGPTLDRKPAKPLQIPEKITTKSVTAKSLGKGTYQKAVLAAVAHLLIPDMLNCVRRNLEMDDMTAAKLTAEIYGMAGKKDAGIVLNVNQNNTAVVDHSTHSGGGAKSFEDIARILDEEEKQRKAIPVTFDAVSFEATPDAVLGIEE